MTPAQRLGAAATARPWSEWKQGNSFLKDGTLVGQSRLDGPRGTYNARWVGYEGPDPDRHRWDLYMHEDDAALIVYAVNHIEQAERERDEAVALLAPLTQSAWRIRGKNGCYCNESPHADRCGTLMHDSERARDFLDRHAEQGEGLK